MLYGHNILVTGRVSRFANYNNFTTSCMYRALKNNGTISSIVANQIWTQWRIQLFWDLKLNMGPPEVFVSMQIRRWRWVKVVKQINSFVFDCNTLSLFSSEAIKTHLLTVFYFAEKYAVDFYTNSEIRSFPTPYIINCEAYEWASSGWFVKLQLKFVLQ